jgi:hypothetical protein
MVENPSHHLNPSTLGTNTWLVVLLFFFVNALSVLSHCVFCFVVIGEVFTFMSTMLSFLIDLRCLFLFILGRCVWRSGEGDLKPICNRK